MELFISDLDGTLLNSQCVISDFSVKTLNSLIEKGLQFTVATARTYASAGKILSGINLKLPVILMNGVLIFNPESRIYEKVCVLKRSLVNLVINAKNKLGLDCFMYTLKDNLMHTYFEKISSKAMEDFYLERVHKYYKTFEKTDDFLNVNNDIIYFTFIDSKEKLQPLYDELKCEKNLSLTFYGDVYNPELWYLEAFSKEASKKNGVLWIKENYGFDKIYSFGDNTNDIPMFEIADVNFAVENSAKELKEIATQIIDSNNNDGVVKKIREIFKGGNHEK